MSVGGKGCRGLGEATLVNLARYLYERSGTLPHQGI